MAQDYHDVSALTESKETNNFSRDHISRECKYRRLHHEATILNDEIQHHIYLYATQECHLLCAAIHAALPRELRDIIYDFLCDAMQPPPRCASPVRCFIFRCLDDLGEEEPPASYLPSETDEDLPPPRPDSYNAHIGDIAFVGERMLYEMAQTWSRRSTIIIAEDWKGVIPVQFSFWDNKPVSASSTHCIVLQATYPLAKYGQGFADLECGLEVLMQFERPLNILIAWDTRAILRDKIRNKEANMIAYFENIVALYPMLRGLLEGGNHVGMTFKQQWQTFRVELADLENEILVSKAHRARFETRNLYPRPQGCWYSDVWTCGSDVCLPRVLPGLR